MTVYVLGVSAYYHDSAACLLRDGEVVAAAQEERFTRKRHDASFPSRAVAYCLREAGIDAARLDHVVFYDRPVPKLARILETHLATVPRGWKTFLKALPLWLESRLWVAREVERELGVEREVLFTEHHQAHAASAFFPSPFERAAVLTLDGVGEWATATAGVGHGNVLELTRELRFPHSLGLLYSAFTGWCGFKVNSGEYKLMGLAPYGEPRFADLIRRELVDVKADGSFALNLAYFDLVGGERFTTARFDALLGAEPRAPGAPLREVDQDAAASIQAVTEDIVLRLARDLHSQTQERALCLAGGVALNCVANGRVVREGTGFEQLWVQPAAGDAGGAMGAAFAVWHAYLGQPRHSEGRDALNGGLLGPSYSSAEVEQALREAGAVSERMAAPQLDAYVARRLDEGAVVGWFQGRMEWGPRALGSRSLLGDPRRPDQQKVMNLKVKGRESFRPFAPAVRAEDARAWFELPVASPYMMLTAPVLAERRAALPAVTHLDGSARVQTVDAAQHPRFHALLTAFAARTGCPVLVNTSFNTRGEPMVCTPAEAYACFMRTQVDVLVVEDFVCERSRQPQYRGPALVFEPD
ncbi:MAG: carbamoyltransferase [Archangiaceae bacterium]|nr:carbamoyltransferase [Archangiaceae bacterium]